MIKVKFLYLRLVVFPRRVETEKESLPHVNFGFLVVMFSICCVFLFALLFRLAYSLMRSFLPLHNKLYYSKLKHFEFFFCSVKHCFECSLLYVDSQPDFGKKYIYLTSETPLQGLNLVPGEKQGSLV